MAKILSKNLKVYPSAYRGQDNGNHIFNPESRLFTELNTTNINRAILDFKKENFRNGSFVITHQKDYEENDIIEFILGGYYFKIKDTKSIFTSEETSYYAHIVVKYTNTDDENLSLTDSALVPIEVSNDQTSNVIKLDSKSVNSQFVFDGLVITNDDTSPIKESDNQISYSLLLIENGKIPDHSKLKFDPVSIVGSKVDPNNVANEKYLNLREALHTDNLIVTNIKNFKDDLNIDTGSNKLNITSDELNITTDHKGIIKNSGEGTKLDFKNNTIKSNNITGSDIVATGTLTVGETNVKDTLTHLQSQIIGNDNDISSLKSQIQSNDSDISGLNNRVATNEGNISNLQSNKADLNEQKKLKSEQFPIDIKVNEADTATKLQTVRNINLSGDASGQTSFDGSQDVTINVDVSRSAALDSVNIGDSTHPVYFNSEGKPVEINKVANASQADNATSATNAYSSDRLGGYSRDDNAEKISGFVPYVDPTSVMCIGSTISFRKSTSTGNLNLAMPSTPSIENKSSKVLILPVPSGGSGSLVLKSYVDSEINSIKTRLNDLGFNSGSADCSGFRVSPTTNSLRKQGKFCIFNFEGTSIQSNQTITIPPGFKPKAATTVIVGVGSYSANLTYKRITMGTDGIIKPGAGSMGEGVHIVNAGWEIA